MMNLNTENEIYKKYLIKLIISIFLILFSLAGINYFLDPYGIYNNKWIIKGWNDKKPLINTHTRIHKTQKVYLKEYECIFLGTSRVEASMVFNSDDSFIKKYCSSYYNAALGSSNIVEMYYMLNLILNHHKPKKIFYGLDFLQFNAMNINFSVMNLDYFNRPLYTRIVYLFSYSMLQDVFRTLKLNEKEENYYDNAGGWNIEKNYLDKFPGLTLNDIFLITEKSYYHIYYDNFNYNFNNLYTWDYYKKMLNIINEHPEIEFFIYTNPFHVRLLEVMDMKIQYQSFEDWKKQLIEMNTQYIKNPKSNFYIYDFSGYNFITTENIDINTKVSHFFYDTSHAKSSVGELILKYILENNYYEDFGIKLDKISIDSYLKEQKIKQQQWREKNKNTIKSIKEFIQ